MTPQETARHQAEVMLHFANGGKIECSYSGTHKWDVYPTPIWNWRDDAVVIVAPPKKVTLCWWLYKVSDNIYALPSLVKPGYPDMTVIRKLTAEDDPRFAPVEVKVEE